MTTTMNDTTKEFIIKDFIIKDEPVGVTRADYESLPCAMHAEEWTDEQMNDLADAIANELRQYSYSHTDEDELEEEMWDAFWKEMENCAVRLGMQYYEDDEDDEEISEESSTDTDIHYFTVNVPGKHGYSFLVFTEEEDEDTVVEMCADIYNDEEDMDYAVAEEYIGEKQISYIKNVFKSAYNLDNENELVEF